MSGVGLIRAGWRCLPRGGAEHNEPVDVSRGEALPFSSLTKRHVIDWAALRATATRLQRLGRVARVGVGERRLRLALIHAASGELQSSRLPAAEIELALATTVLGATGGDRR